MIRTAVELTPDKPIDTLARAGQAAESAPFDGIFVSSHYNNRDPFQALDRLAMRTDSIALGPGVVNPYEAHPAVQAARVATLHESSGGRAVLGIGAGDRSTLRSLGIERESPLGRVRASIQLARRLFDGQRVEMDDHVAVADAKLNIPLDEYGPIPIFVGAQGPQMLRMSGIYADGVLINASHERDVAWAAEQVGRTIDRRPPDRDPPTLLAHACVSVADAAAPARRAVRPPVAFIAAGAETQVLERHGVDPDLASSIGSAIATGEYESAFGQVSTAMIDAFAIAGTPETVADRLATLLDIVDGVVVGAPIGPDPPDAVTRAGRALAMARDAANR